MTVQHLYNALAAVAVIGLLLIGSLYVLWGRHDKRHEDHAERLAVLEARLGDADKPPATEPMRRVDVIGGARTQVAAAREANRERPTPFPRGRHRAGGLSQDQAG